MMTFIRTSDLGYLGASCGVFWRSGCVSCVCSLRKAKATLRGIVDLEL